MAFYRQWQHYTYTVVIVARRRHSRINRLSLSPALLPTVAPTNVAHLLAASLPGCFLRKQTAQRINALGWSIKQVTKCLPLFRFEAEFGLIH